MEIINQIVWYKNLDWSAIWVCLMAVLVHLLHLKVNKKEITKYQYLFYVLSSFLVLTFISEIGMPFVKYFANLPIELEGSIIHFLAALSGLGGGYVTTVIIKKFKK